MAAISSIDIKQSFQLFDIDGNGVIDAEEMQLAMRTLGFEWVRSGDVQKMMRQISHDLDGITFDEFEAMIRQEDSRRDSPEEIMKAFCVFDVDKTGVITLDNLQTIAHALGETDDEATLIATLAAATAGTDSACLDFAAFSKVMRQMGNRTAEPSVE
eukprot:TRINITY_DN1367_c0_g1_i1.p1 TRINITY_DN1367_c0_g1~~TRINITY_DN1367_c0_g1_i1.p1  ORF type:complete len:181 (+),score=55.25 TRINITY_DN1367_c0_g1_i1:74-544(+)